MGRAGRTDMHLKLFAPGSDQAFGERVAAALGVPLAVHEEREFEDGEHKLRPLESVRGCDVYVLASLYGAPGTSANDKLVRLLFFAATLRDASAASVTVVAPYLCYARKDRRTKARDPVSSRYLAQLLEAVGVTRVVALDVHNVAAFQNAFRIPVEHLEAGPLFAAELAALIGAGEAIVVSPDAGGVKRAEALRERLEAALRRPVGRAFMEKRRSAGVVSGDLLAGEVAGRTAIIVDDLISSGTTLARAARACREHGAAQVYAAATHGLFSTTANEVLADMPIAALLITDTVPPFRLPDAARSRVRIVSAATLFASAIRELHLGGSIVALMEGLAGRPG